MRDDTELSGRVLVQARASDGHLVAERFIRNYITETGRRTVAKLCLGNAKVKQTWIRIGNNSDPGPIEDGPDNPLVKEGSYQEVLATVEIMDRTEVDDRDAKGRLRSVAVIEATFAPPTQGGESDEVIDLREAGVALELEDPNRKILYNRATFDLIRRGPEVSITIRWEVLF